MAQLVVEQEPTIIGLYGLPGSGKSTILDNLRADPSYSNFLIIEGSAVIAKLVEGGLDAFKRLGEHEKDSIRRGATEKIRDECLEQNKNAVVAGNFSFWNDVARDYAEVWTDSDAKVFTHVIYLAVDGEKLAGFVEQDESRPDRGLKPADQLDYWRDEEISQLKKHCADNSKDVMFKTVTQGMNSTLDEVKQLIDGRNHDEKSNRDRVAATLKAALEPLSPALDAVLLIDGDKTLAPHDTGALLQKQIIGPGPRKDPLPGIFNTHGYTFTGFREAAMEYEKEGSDAHFIGECEKVVRRVKMHPEFVYLLQQVAGSQSVRALVVTSGLRIIWERVLEQAELSHVVRAIGGGREKDYVVTPKIKAMIARVLKENGLYVLALGDSVIDLPMLLQADEAIVVTGDEKSRSKSMEVEVKRAIAKDCLQARQILLPPTVSARLDGEKLPHIRLEDLSVTNALFGTFEHVEATGKTAAKLLMTPNRDAAVHGPALREAHRNVGRYLATEYLSEYLGLQQYQTQHVQPGKSADGYRLFHEKITLLIPLMRRGEPMAFGVSDIFLLAAFLHAKQPADIEKKHLRGMANAILVDGVVNSGDSLVEFIKRVRELRPSVRIVALSGVTQEDAVKNLPGKLAGCGGVTLFSLRTSENKFTGKGGTDTGARLFGTTEME
ncbi:hypothetical protein M409DRAFT_27654 [Zasmidium cellare ATCC 36951]|uniref:Phosphoribosyltransferase domain-containing protein n=1 Tax=Zasmidium cellare ATCC 36951 TaxID=1080233 RepID=A0A6A6C6P0_ZASCE|nr:uncharacterized protein M409DRAFT_27654 [Zasmidium cellare ATCC 36951]KAF2161928.1 hypothetical protein M409DRAFT_27654 [Zasmidium cellare ATCC 36951]